MTDKNKLYRIKVMLGPDLWTCTYYVKAKSMSDAHEQASAIMSIIRRGTGNYTMITEEPS